MNTYHLADLFEAVVDSVPQRTALVAGGVRLSFSELDQRANRLAHHLISVGLGQGDPIGIYSYNRVEWVEALWACFKIRALPININYRYLTDELFYIADNAELKALIFERGFAPHLIELQDSLPQLRHYLAIEDGSGTDITPLAAAEYETALSEQSRHRGFAPRSSDDLYMLYTGGTTGMPKGTVWRHEDLFFAALLGGNPVGPPISEPGQLPQRARTNPPLSALCPAPLMHGSGQWFCMIHQLAGLKLTLYCERHFDARRLVKLIEEEQVQSLILVGDAMARPLVEAIAAGCGDVSSLTAVGSGGAPLSDSVKRHIKQQLPTVTLLDRFGASETGAGGQAVNQIDSAAGPRFTLAPNTAVLDANLTPVAPGETGLLARCGHIPLGYYKDEAKTTATFQTDAKGVRWVIPGDWARLHRDGTAELLGRGSACINSGGEKIFPEEVEAVLKAHPDVFDAGVIGAEDERFGQKVVALVQLRPEAGFDRNDITTFCRRKIAGYKCPRHLFAVEKIPRTPAAKPDYRQIKALVESLLLAER